MKKHLRSVSGLTFIEAVMFLGVIAGIAAIGLYYYGIIGIGGKTDEVLEKIRAINQAVSSMPTSGGTALNSLSTESIASMLPSDGLTTPWNTKIVLAGTSSDSYTINIPMMPAAICTRVMDVLSTNQRYDLSATTCPDDKNATVSFTYTYFINQQ